jgi:cysteine desulfurase
VSTPLPLIYLDHAATTPMRPAAVEAMLPFLSERYANPNGSHRAARDARRALDEARDVVAECLGVLAGEVVFTGCGTEADNAAVLGVVRRSGGIPLCSSVEHHAVLHPVEHLGGIVVPVDRAGRMDLLELEAALCRDGLQPISVVSVMTVNNEVGTVQPIAAVSALVRRHAPDAVLHTDAIQAPTWLDLAPITAAVDMLSLSGHKFGGPKGVGVLFVREGSAFEPIVQGGGQERDRRSGTQNVAGIVAFAEALRLTVDEREATNARVAALRDRFISRVLATCPGALETVAPSDKIAGSAHLCFEGCESEALLFLLDQEGICASAASACASGAMEPSHVLAAMNVPKEQAVGAVRFSLGPTTTDDEIDRAVAAIGPIVTRLRSGVGAAREAT